MADSYFVFGRQPALFRVPLTIDSDFVRTLEADPSWPVGTALAITFPDAGITAWSATVSGADASWSIDKAVCNTVPHGTKVRLVYTNGTTDLVLALGTVARFDD